MSDEKDRTRAEHEDDEWTSRRTAWTSKRPRTMTPSGHASCGGRGLGKRRFRQGEGENLDRITHLVRLEPVPWRASNGPERGLQRYETATRRAAMSRVP